MGTEIYWHGILDYSSRENRRIREITDIHEKFKQISELAGSQYEAKVGILETYDNKFDAELDVWHGAVENASRMGLYTASQMTHTPVDFVYLRENTTAEELVKYSVLFYPHAVILDNKQIEVLKKYVEQGGTLVFGCRAGLKNANGRIVQEELPGLAAELAGTEVAEFTLVAGEEAPIYVDWEGNQLEAAVFNDELAPYAGTKILGTYSSSYYQGVPALTEHSVGKGRVLYFGGAFTRDTAETFFRKLNVIAPYADQLELPEECELSVRVKDGVRYMFILNYSKEEKTIQLKKPVKNLYTGETMQGEKVLAGYETLVVKA